MLNETRLLLLPGNNPDQRDWIEAVRDELAPLYRDATVLYYGHWDKDDTPYIDFEDELARVGELASLGSWDVLAKSAGVLLVLMAAARGVLVPERSFFLGAPFLWTQQQGMPVSELLAAFRGGTVFIQQSHDPACPVTDLRSILAASGIKSYQIEELPGASHHYGDLLLIKGLVQKHLSKM